MLKEPKIIFHHIPKCGGTSIVTGLVMTYYPMRFLRYGRKGFPGLLNAPKSSKAAEMADIDIYSYRRTLLMQHVESNSSPYISGHYPFSSEIHKEYGEDWNCITLLRDPVKRFYSEYLWNRYKDHDYKRTDLSLEAYLESDQGRMNARSFVNFLSDSTDHTASPKAKEVQEATEAISKMRVVGSLEHMDRFRHDLKQAFGRKPFFFNRNSSPAPQGKKAMPDKNSDVYKKMLDMTEGDREIYQAALSLIGV